MPAKRSRQKRYASAEALAADLAPVPAAASRSRPARSATWSGPSSGPSGHPAAATLGLTSGLAVLTLLAVSVAFNVRLRDANSRTRTEADDARSARDEAVRQRKNYEDEANRYRELERVAEGRRIEAVREKELADRRLKAGLRGAYALLLFQAAALAERDPQRAYRLLDDKARCPEDYRDFTWRHLRTVSRVEEQTFDRVGTPITQLAFCPAGDLLAASTGTRKWCTSGTTRPAGCATP